MEVIKQSVGIDIAKNTFTSCVAVIASNQKVRLKRAKTFDNNVKGFSSFMKWVIEQTDSSIKTCFVMEPTGVYHENLAYWLYALGKEVCIPLSNKVKNYAKSLNIRSKTDDIDAKVIALLGAERALEPWKLCSPNLVDLRQLTREYESLQDERSKIGSKIHNIEHAHNVNERIKNRLYKRLELIDLQVQQTVKDMNRLLKKDKILGKKIDNILTIKGVGLITAVTIVAETQGFSLINNRKQLVSYAGYDVVERQSGTSIKGKTRISKKGNHHIRRILHFPALVAATHSPSIKTFYNRVNEGKSSKKIGCVAVQKKLLVMMYSIWKNNTTYSEDYTGNSN